MIAKAIARFIRISPRKTRLVTYLLKKKTVGEALAILSALNRRAAEIIEELLRSAIANAKQNPDIQENNLYISKLTVDGGPTLKRYRAASMGRASKIRHRTSHIRVELDLIKKIEPKARKQKKNIATKTSNKKRRI